MQPNDVGTQRDLVLYRIEAAKEDLKSAKILRDADSYKGANNRAYYAIFHAINAVHGLRGVEEIWHASDYDDFYIATVEEVEEQIAVAEEFIQMVEDFCNQHLDGIL